jgi:hypothetical protein
MNAPYSFRAIGLIVAVLTVGASGCSTMDNTSKGAGIGGALGTGAGLAVGAATHPPLLGAAVGGLTGAGVGAAIGNDQDRVDQQKRDFQQATAVANAQAQQRMGMTDVIAMVQQGHDEQVIINQIRNTGSVFQLSPSDLNYLKQNNVPSRVIVEMQTARPVLMAAPSVVYQPAPAPPVVFVQPRPYYYRRPYYGW